MNVMGDDCTGAVPLMQMLSLVDEGTRVRVSLDRRGLTCTRRISRPQDVMAVCAKASREMGHHPKVYNVTARHVEQVGDILEVRCR